jgi:hypothetical protein
MSGNGDISEGWTEDRNQVRHLLAGGADAVVCVNALTRAADALLSAGRVMNNLATGLTKISSDVARALSDNVELKRHLRSITEREQVVLLQLNELKSQMFMPKPNPPSKKPHKRKKSRRK